MEKPDLNQMWETFIRIPAEEHRLNFNELYDTVRLKIQPMIAYLTKNKVINWYCFLIHDKNSGVPTTEDDSCPYFHIRFALKKGMDSPVFQTLLPKYCVLTRKIESGLESISGIDKNIIKNDDISEVWRVIGEQCEWFLHLLNIHKESAPIPPQQIAQFLHFFANMTQLRVS